MSGLDLCPKCKGIHFRNAPCIVRKLKFPTAPHKFEDIDDPNKTGLAPYMVDPAPQKRPVGRPKTITDMRAYKAERARKYRADKKAAKSPPPKPSIQTTTEERNE